ncbi:hypothetical protein I552_3141, partial [Mycobacterium xenopi 3993]
MIAAAVVGYLLVVLLYRWFPPITVWTGVSLLALATPRRRGAGMCGPRSTTARSATGRLATSAGGGSQRDDRQGLGVVAPWCSAGGSGCWCTCCRGAR